MGTWVQKTVWSIIVYLFDQTASEWADLAWTWFSRLFTSPLAVIDDPLVQRLTQLAIGAVLGFLPVALAWMAVREIMLRMEGSSTTPPTALVRRGLVTGLAVTGTSLVAWFMGTLAEHARAILGAMTLDIMPLQQFFSPVLLQPTLSFRFLTLIFVVGAVVVTIQRFIVAAEFSVLLIIGPFMATGLLREDGSSNWTIWLRETTSLLITPLIQLLVTYLFVRKWTEISDPLEIGDRLMGLALLYVLWNTPRWARQMVYSSGAGNAVVGTAVNAGRMVIIRQLVRAVAKV